MHLYNTILITKNSSEQKNQDYSFQKKTKQKTKNISTSSTHTESLLLIHTCFPEDTVCQLCFKNIVQGYFQTSYISDSNLKRKAFSCPSPFCFLELSVKKKLKHSYPFA